MDLDIDVDVDIDADAGGDDDDDDDDYDYYSTLQQDHKPRKIMPNLRDAGVLVVVQPQLDD